MRAASSTPPRDRDRADQRPVAGHQLTAGRRSLVAQGSDRGQTCCSTAGVGELVDSRRGSDPLTFVRDSIWGTDIDGCQAVARSQALDCTRVSRRPTAAQLLIPLPWTRFTGPRNPAGSSRTPASRRAIHADAGIGANPSSASSMACCWPLWQWPERLVQLFRSDNDGSHSSCRVQTSST